MKTKTLLFNFCFLVLISIQTGFSQGKEWSQFRGENSCGIAAKDATPPIEFGETQNLHWRINVPVGSSSPVIWDDQIYITAYDEENSNLETICLDRNSGIILWKDVIHPDKFETPHPLGNPASSSATVDEDGVYIYFSSYGLKCMSHEGKSRWDYPMPVPEKVLYGHPTSPVLMDDKLILCKDYGNDDTRCLMAFDKSTGQVIWKSMIGKNTPINANGFPGYSTPVRLRNQIIIHRCGGIASYSLDNGSPIWWIMMRTTGVSTPVIKDDVVYVGAWSELSEKERRGDIFNYSSFDTLINDFDNNSDQLIEWDEIPEDMMIFSRPEINDIEDTQISVRRAFNGIDANKDGYINKEEWERRINLMNPKKRLMQRSKVMVV